MLGREVGEGQQPVTVVGDLGERLGIRGALPFGACVRHPWRPVLTRPERPGSEPVQLDAKRSSRPACGSRADQVVDGESQGKVPGVSPVRPQSTVMTCPVT
jgi:hypothetical protein